MSKHTPCTFPAAKNTSVQIATLGTPRSSKTLLSCILHDIQDPQSARPSITKSARSARSVSNSIGAGRENDKREKGHGSTGTG